MNYFIELKNMPGIEALQGAFLSNVHTENFTVAYTDMKAGAEVPLHQHPEEAIDIILEGVLDMVVGNQNIALTHGMIAIVPSNIPHQAKAITDCKVVTIFYPKRNM